jgi:transposase-like protein
MGKQLIPATMLEAVRQFSNKEKAHEFFVQIRFPNGVACPRCGTAEPAFMPKVMRWYCTECKKQFSAKVGTIFEDSPIGLDKWLPAIWLIASNRNGISSYEIARALKVTQKTAWFMLHRIREAMADPCDGLLEGPVEADETYVGGLTKSMNAKRRAKYRREWSGQDKAAVMGIVQRNTPERKGKARAWVVPFVEGRFLKENIRRHVRAGDPVYTDGATWYKGLTRDYVHETVDHHALEYVRGHVHTNSIEAFFSVFKRTIKGTYVAPRAKHLQRYVEEQVFRFNAREQKDGPRFAEATKRADGKRLTYKALIAKR